VDRILFENESGTEHTFAFRPDGTDADKLFLNAVVNSVTLANFFTAATPGGTTAQHTALRLPIIKGSFDTGVGALGALDLKPGGMNVVTGNSTLPTVAQIVAAFHLDTNDGFWLHFYADGGAATLDHAAADGGNWTGIDGAAFDWPNGADNNGGAGAFSIAQDEIWSIYVRCVNATTLAVAAAGTRKNDSIL
jgi:hypothetical protein